MAKKKPTKSTAKKIVKKTAKTPGKVPKAKQEVVHRKIDIPELEQGEFTLQLVGDRPLMVNNKLAVAKEVAEQYSGIGKAGAVKKKHVSTDDQYARAFYVMPYSKYEAPSPKAKYGIPASGIKKCVCKAIRTTGITDNTTIGLISNSFWIMEQGSGFVEIAFDSFVEDVRAVNIGSGVKTVPQMRHRPLFHGWSVDVIVRYNERVLTQEQIVNLFMHAGQYIGLCEMRAEKKQGSCGGFNVKPGKHRQMRRGK